jgi:hypothetical protein
MTKYGPKSIEHWKNSLFFGRVLPHVPVAREAWLRRCPKVATVGHSR